MARTNYFNELMDRSGAHGALEPRPRPSSTNRNRTSSLRLTFADMLDRATHGIFSPGLTFEQGEDISSKAPDTQTGLKPEERTELFDENQKRQEIMSAAAEFEKYATRLESEQDLPAETKLHLQQTREMIAEQVTQAELEQNRVVRKGAADASLVRNMIDQQFGDQGFLTGIDEHTRETLNVALGLHGADAPAPTHQDLEAVANAIMDSNLSDEDKTERLMFLTDRMGSTGQLMTAMDNVQHDFRALQTIGKLMDLGNFGNAHEYAKTELGMDLAIDPMAWDKIASPLDVQAAGDPLTQKQLGVMQMVDTQIEEAIGHEIPDSMALRFISGDPNRPGIIDNMISMEGYTNTPGFKTLVNELAKDLDIPTSSLMNILLEGERYGDLRVEMWDSALGQTQFSPMSEHLSMAIFQVAAPIIGPEEAQRFAESQDLHAIIQAQSEGFVGQNEGGDKRGIGGLPELAYDQYLGVPYEEVRGDTAREIEALVMYIAQNFGDPVRAAQYYKQTGMWGE